MCAQGFQGFGISAFWTMNPIRISILEDDSKTRSRIVFSPNKLTLHASKLKSINGPESIDVASKFLIIYHDDVIISRSM